MGKSESKPVEPSKPHMAGDITADNPPPPVEYTGADLP